MSEITPDANFDLDLDTLSADKKRVKINGQGIEIAPPALEDLIDLAKLGGKLQKIQGTGQATDPEEMIQLMDDLKSGLVNLVPELKDHKLNLEQLLALIDLLVSSAQPADAKELEKRGIKLDGDQKKTA